MKPGYLLTLFLLGFPCAAQTGSVQGLVLTSGGRQPVRKASVTITSVKPDRSYAIAITDAAGQFTFTGIPQGQYRIAASRAGFLSVPYGSGSPGRPGHLLELAKGETRAGVTLMLAQVGTIGGRVFDPDGDPVASVQIALFQKQWSNGSERFVRVSNRQTDQSGRYIVNDLPAGQYWMAAIPNFVRALPVRSVATAGVKPPEQVFSTQFYPGVERFVNAAPISVASGQDLTEVNYHLSYVPQAHLLGSLTGVPDDTTVVKAALLSEVPGDLAGAFYVPIRTERRQFELRGVAAGAYRFWVAAGGRRVIRDVQLNGDENRVDVELPPGIPVRGWIQGIDPSESSYKNLQIALSPADDLPATDIRTQLRSNSFELGEVPVGRWSVTVSGFPAGTYLKSLRFGEQDILGKPLILQANSKGSLEIVLLPNAPRVTGTLKPAGAATVLAAPRGELGSRTTLYRTTQTSEAGNFFFGDLSPGTYVFCALADPETNAWQAPDFLPKIEAGCKPVELKEGATENLQLTNPGVPPL